ncbi:MAG: histidine phosphatase family protein [Pseudoruegeria sp.]
MSDIYWVRHGPTHERAFTGWRDVPADLSDHAQIDRLNQFLPMDALVVSSDLKRAMDTATALQGNRVRLPHHKDLREFDFGEWDGKHFSEVSNTHPELSRAYWEKPGDVAAPGGESWNMVVTRVDSAVDVLLAAYPNRPIIAVAHFGVILTQLQRGLGVTPYQALSHTIDNFSINHVTYPPRPVAAPLINHLP